MCLGVPVIASRTAVHQYYYDESIIQYYSNDDAEELATQMLGLRKTRRCGKQWQPEPGDMLTQTPGMHERASI